MSIWSRGCNLTGLLASSVWGSSPRSILYIILYYLILSYLFLSYLILSYLILPSSPEIGSGWWRRSRWWRRLQLHATNGVLASCSKSQWRRHWVHTTFLLLRTLRGRTVGTNLDWRTLIQRQVLPHAEAVEKVHVIEDYITLYYITYDDVIFCCHRTIHMMMKYLTFFKWALPLKWSTRRSSASGSYLIFHPWSHRYTSEQSSPTSCKVPLVRTLFFPIISYSIVKMQELRW